MVQQTTIYFLNSCQTINQCSTPIPSPHLVAQLHPHLLSHTSRHTHGCYTSRLRAPDLLAVLGEAGLVQVLGDLRGLAGAGLSFNDEHLVILDGLHQLVSVSVDRQTYLALLDRLFLLLVLGQRLLLTLHKITD